MGSYVRNIRNRGAPNAPDLAACDSQCSGLDRSRAFLVIIRSNEISLRPSHALNRQGRPVQRSSFDELDLV